MPRFRYGLSEDAPQTSSSSDLGQLSSQGGTPPAHVGRVRIDVKPHLDIHDFHFTPNIKGYFIFSLVFRSGNL